MTGSTTKTSPPRRKPTAQDITRCVLVTAASGPAAWLCATLLSHRTLGSHEQIGTIVLAVLALGAAVKYSMQSWAWSGIFLSVLLLFPLVFDRRCLLLASLAIPILTAVALDRWVAWHRVFVVAVILALGALAVLGASALLARWPGSVDQLLVNAWDVQWSMRGEQEQLSRTRGEWERAIGSANVNELETWAKRELQTVKATAQEARQKEHGDYLQEAIRLYRRAAEQLNQTQKLVAAVRSWERANAKIDRNGIDPYEKAALAQADARAAQAAASRAAGQLEASTNEYEQAAEWITAAPANAARKAQQVAGAKRYWDDVLHDVEPATLTKYANAEFAQAQDKAREAASRASAGDADSAVRLYDQAVKILQRARIPALLAEAQTNDSKEHGRVALAALAELLKLAPDHAEAKALQAKIAGYFTTTNTIGMKFAWISPGTFMMGSPAGEQGRSSDETQHPVTLTKAFYLQTTPVTQAQWKAVMGADPSNFKGDDLPVESVSWNDAVDFCRRLSEREGKHYRLPTEAEWEYACRAGTTTRFYTGDDDQSLDRAGWYSGNSGSQTHPVGQKQPNAFGLYDMHGNVWQWCSDVYDSNYPAGPVSDPVAAEPAQNPNASRVLRGGSWNFHSVFCRSAFRYGFAPGLRGYGIGFRVVLDSP